MKIIQEPKNYNKIMIVGEAPGKDEARLKFPFVGYEGRYLRKKLAKAGIDFTSCFVTNTVHEQPRGNRYETLSQEARTFGRTELIKDINRYKPNIIIAIGAKALETLCGKTSIYKFRGSVIPCTLVPLYKVLPTVHPGAIFRGSSTYSESDNQYRLGNAKYDIILQMDLKKAAGESLFPEIRRPERCIDVIRAVRPALCALEELSHSTTPHAVDIETAGPRLITYGIATSAKEAVVIPKELLDLPEVLRAVSRYAASNAPKIFHNLLFDVFHNAYYYRILNRNIFYDTMLAQHAIFPTLPKSLAFCSSIYTNEVYWKDEGKEVIKSTNINKITDWESFYIYNGKDCCVTYEVYERQQEELDIWDARGIFNLMMRLTKPNLYSMMTGMRINRATIEEFRKENEEVIEKLQRIKSATIGDVNIASPKQLKELLYDTWGLPLQKKKGKPTTDKLALRKLETYPVAQKPLIGLINTIKTHTKLRDFYRLHTDRDDRIRFSGNISGTYTGRWSTSKCITGSGLNLQNQPPAVRKFYEVDDGKIFVEWDLSNAEAKIVAACCQDAEWLAKFEVQDQHTFVASELFHIPIEKVTKEQRNKYAKRVAHACHYMLGWGKLSLFLLCAANEAKKFKKRYFEIRPRLGRWHYYVTNDIAKTRIIRTCFGRNIQFFGPKFDTVLPAAVAAEPQSTCGDYLNHSLVAVYEQIPEAEYKLQVHDSVLIELPDELSVLERVLPQIKKISEIPITVHGLTFSIPIDFKIGYRWGEMLSIPDLKDIKSVYETLQIP